MIFNKNDQFTVYMMDNIGWIDITSYKNCPEQWSLDDLKNRLYELMYETTYTVLGTTTFKVKLSYWGDFHPETAWFSKKIVKGWIKNNYSKDALWLLICRDILKIKE